MKPKKVMIHLEVLTDLTHRILRQKDLWELANHFDVNLPDRDLPPVFEVRQIQVSDAGHTPRKAAAKRKGGYHAK